MSKKAWMFSGQGTQEVGMGRELLEAFKEVADVAKKAEDVTNRPVRKMMLEGPKDLLDRTSNTQIAVVVISLGLLAVYLKKHRDERPDFVIGHSVGEGPAAAAAESMDVESTLVWTHERGLAMEEEGARNPGKMAAILGMKDAVVERIARTTGAYVANYNVTDQQTVISGGADEVDAGIDAANEQGAKKVVPLDVTVPAHTPLLAGAIDRVSKAMDGIHVLDPIVPIAANAARFITSGNELKAALPEQLRLPVKFSQSIELLRNDGVTEFLEFGHTDVLSRIVKRQLRGEDPIVRHAKDDL